MVDSTHLPEAASDAVCPWCSAAVTAETATCPSCSAILITAEEHDLPGLTAVDEGIARRVKTPPQRGRFLSWFAGESPEQPTTAASAQAIAPPDEAVRREILRLELTAHISNLQAEADSILSDALVEGRVDDLPEGLRPLAAAEANAETPEEIADAMINAAVAADADAAEGAGTEASDADASAADDSANADAADAAKADDAGEADTADEADQAI